MRLILKEALGPFAQVLMDNYKVADTLLMVAALRMVIDNALRCSGSLVELARRHNFALRMAG